MQQFDPLRDARWNEFLRQHPLASVFHTPQWLEALRRTYGYEPVAYTTAATGQELKNAVVFCRVRSWLTGNRMVSLPFADHCEPLTECTSDMDTFLPFLEQQRRHERCRYFELRPLSYTSDCEGAFSSWGSGEEFELHRLDLRPALEDIFRGFHKSCIQRKIRKAEKEMLTYEEGRSESLLGKFYGLLLLTRRRHQIPPQPLAWFRNLIACLGKQLSIRVASKDGRAVASILTLTHRNTVVYKYGCSNEDFHNLGGMPFLFWQTIEEAKQSGLGEFDLGRSEVDNAGLIAYKNHWGATRSRLRYVRFPKPGPHGSTKGALMRAAKHVFRTMPGGLMTTAGRVLYRHIG